MPLPLNQSPSSLIRSRTGLTQYVVRTTALCATAALACDIANQLIFFVSWPVALRSWLITICVVVVIAVPVARAIGKAQLALFHASQTDPLTGLLNRRALLEGIHDPAALMVLMIADVDRFKAVNDTYGHMAGDDVLRSIATMLQQQLGDLGRVGRLGGEEFALICGRPGEGDLMRRLEDFRETVARTPVLSGSTAVSVTISAGVAYRAQDQNFEQLYAEADRALYQAKTRGRNQIVVAQANEQPTGSRRSGATDRGCGLGWGRGGDAA